MRPLSPIGEVARLLQTGRMIEGFPWPPRAIAPLPRPPRGRPESEAYPSFYFKREIGARPKEEVPVSPLLGPSGGSKRYPGSRLWEKPREALAATSRTSLEGLVMPRYQRSEDASEPANLGSGSC